MEYPYSSVQSAGFMMCRDRMEWFGSHARRTRNTFLLRCVRGRALMVRDMDSFEIRPGMEWTLLPDCVIQLRQVSGDFCVHYCVCSPGVFDEVTHDMPTAFLDHLSESGPIEQTGSFSRRFSSLCFDQLQLVADDRDNAYRTDIMVGIMRNYYVNLMDKEQSRIGSVQKRYGSAGDKLIKRFWNLLIANYQQHREVEWYADRLCVSRRYLAQVFKTLSGTTPKQAIDDYLVLEIKIELRSTHDSVQQIAERLHFADQSVMGRFFKSHTGMSPLRYRCSEV